MERAGAIRILSPFSPIDLKGILDVYGASWNEEIPAIFPEDTPSILVTHRMIIKDTKLWEGQENYEIANNLLKNNRFELIVTGDNHQHFVEEYDGRFLVNCGSLMRSTSAQVDHIPVIYIWDSETKELIYDEIPIEPIENVMNLKKLGEDKENDEKLEAFVKGLQDQQMEGFDFKENLYIYIKENNIPEPVETIIETILNRIE
jgi:hypothetical protein